MLGRHQPPSEGDVLLDGQPLDSWSSKAFARKVAYLPQQLPPAEGMTVRELVAIGRYPWHGALGRLAPPTARKWKRRLRWSVLSRWRTGWLTACPAVNGAGVDCHAGGAGQPLFIAG